MSFWKRLFCGTRNRKDPSEDTSAAVQLTKAEQLRSTLAQLYGRGEYAQALPVAVGLCEVTQRAVGNNHPDYAACLNNLAEVYREMGNYTQAEPLYRRAAAIDRAAFGEDHEFYATDINNLALLYQALGRNGDAEPLFQQALSIYRKTSDNDHPMVAVSLNNLARLYHAQGQYDTAENLFQEARALQQAAGHENQPAYAMMLNNLAALYRTMGRYREAEPLYREALLAPWPCRPSATDWRSTCSSILAILQAWRSQASSNSRCPSCGGRSFCCGIGAPSIDASWSRSSCSDIRGYMRNTSPRMPLN
jgi:tetratricopeptide (TPR) repeat protein